MQCVEQELGHGGIETVGPAFVRAVVCDDAAESNRSSAPRAAGAVPAVVSILDNGMWARVRSSAPMLSSVASAFWPETVVIDAIEEEGEEFLEEQEDDDDFEDDDFDDLDDLDDDYEDEDEEFEPDLEEDVG